MVGNNINLFGSNVKHEATVEEKLTEPLVHALDAVATTFEAFGQNERAYLNDIRGEEQAVENFEACIEKVQEAQRRWKKAEHKKSGFHAFLSSLDRDDAVRPSVREEIAAIDPGEFVEQLNAEGRFVGAEADDPDTLAEFGQEFLGVELNDEWTADDGDEGWQEVEALLTLDQRAIQQVQVALRNWEVTLREAQEDVEASRVFEAMNHSYHNRRQHHPVSLAAEELHTAVVKYQAYTEAYGSYFQEAIMRAEDSGEQIWPETEAQLWPEEDVDAELDSGTVEAEEVRQRPRQG